MYHLIYQVTNLITGKYYRGKHSTDDPEDGYLGSGRIIRDAINKHGEENFRKEILFCALTEKDAYYVEEHVFITRKEVEDQFCYNIYTGGKGACSYDIAGEKHPKYGTKHSEITIEKIRQKRILNNKMRGIASEDHPMYGIRGENNPKTGCKHSEEAKQRQSEALMGENNPMFNCTGKSNPQSIEVKVDGHEFECMAEAARYFGKSTKTISNWVKKGVHGSRKIDD